MILIINLCKEKLHYFEFVKPIEDIAKSSGKRYIVKHYSSLNKKDLNNSSKIIICGTSLKDNSFLENINDFSWIKDYSKPILGICAGMQIIGLLYGGKLDKEIEIGFFEEKFKKNFLGLTGKQGVYHLHNNYASFSGDFEVYCENKIPQAVKHKGKQIYGVLFHPEVRQKSLIINFLEQ